MASLSKRSFHSTQNQNDSVAIVILEHNGTADTILLPGIPTGLWETQ